MKPTDNREEPLKYEDVRPGDWVILSSDQTRVIVHDPDLGRAIAAARERGEKGAVIMKAEALGLSLIS